MRLFRWFVLRRMAQERGRTGLAIGGIALGIAVVLAVRLANASAIGGFAAALDTVAVPGIPGRMVAEQIRDSHPETKVLYVSGHTNDDVVRTGVLHDAVHFVQKPFAPAAIAHKVREILSS